jgi:integrase
MPTSEGWVAFWWIPRAEGKPRRKRARLGIKKSTPLKEAEAAFGLWVRAREAALGQDQKLTVGQIMSLYIADRRKEGKRVDKMEFQWRSLKKKFEHMQPADLETEIEVEGEQRTRCHLYAVERDKIGRARDTIHSELNLLRTAMAWAAKRKKTAPVFVWVPSAGKPRRTALTLKQIASLIEAIHDATLHIRLLIVIALATGARKQAILELTWPRVDLDHRTIDFNTGEKKSILDTSHQKGRAVVDIGEGLYALLKEAKEYAHTDHVIEYRGKPVKDPKDGVKAVFMAAGLSGRFLGLHALRHTLATSAAELGIDMRKIQHMLGHDDIKTTEAIYVELRRGFLSEVAEVAEPHLKLINMQKSVEKTHP